MVKELDVPALRKGGDDVILTTTTIAGAIIDLIAPLAGTAFAQSVAHLVRTRMEKASEILLEELRKGNIEVLTHEKSEAFIPMAYRFYEAARLGSTVRKLEFLAKCLIGAVNLESYLVDDFLRISAKLEKLSDEDLEFIIIIRNTVIKKRKEHLLEKTENADEIYACAKSINNDHENNFNSSIINMKLSRLHSAGFLYPTGGSFWDQESEYYYLDDDFELVCKLALKQSEKS